MDNEMLLVLKSLPENVGVARVAVAAFASALGMKLVDLEEVKVCVSEAVSNVVLHAYPNSCGEVRISARSNGDMLHIEVADNGVGIPDVQKAREPGFTTIPDHMGLGFSFMESFSDSFEVSSSPGQGTRVRMSKRI